MLEQLGEELPCDVYGGGEQQLGEELPCDVYGGGGGGGGGGTTQVAKDSYMLMNLIIICTYHANYLLVAIRVNRSDKSANSVAISFSALNSESKVAKCCQVEQPIHQSPTSPYVWSMNLIIVSASKIMPIG